MSLYRSLPVSKRHEVYKLYKEAYPDMQYRDMVKHFDGGGTIGEKEQNQLLTANNDYPSFPYDGTSKFKGGYDIDKAREIYTPDETGHLPTVDYRTGEWLKSKDYPTSWMELNATQLNVDLNKEVGFPTLNERGNLQYNKGYSEQYDAGGTIDGPEKPKGSSFTFQYAPLGWKQSIGGYYDDKGEYKKLTFDELNQMEDPRGFLESFQDINTPKRDTKLVTEYDNALTNYAEVLFKKNFGYKRYEGKPNNSVATYAQGGTIGEPEPWYKKYINQAARAGQTLDPLGREYTLSDIQKVGNKITDNRNNYWSDVIGGASTKTVNAVATLGMGAIGDLNKNLGIQKEGDFLDKYVFPSTPQSTIDYNNSASLANRATYAGEGLFAGIGNLMAGETVNKGMISAYDIGSNIIGRFNDRLKPNLDMMYRGIGKEGYEDAIKSGVLRPKQITRPDNYHEMSLIEKVNFPKIFGKTYYAPGNKFNVVKGYGAGYIAEVPKDAARFVKRYGRHEWSQMTERQIPIEEANIYKKHWLYGYENVKRKNYNLDINY